MEPAVEFVSFDEVWPEFKTRGVIRQLGGSGRPSEDGPLELAIDAARRPVTIVLGGASGSTSAEQAAPHATIPCGDDRVASALEAVLHKLHLAPLHLIPVGRWREIFDAVSFELAAHDRWQEIDAQASLEQNSRDPLRCEARDLHMLREVVRALLANGEGGAAQALTIVATGQLLVVRVEPGRPLELHVGNAGVADQLRDAANHYLSGGGAHA